MKHVSTSQEHDDLAQPEPGDELVWTARAIGKLIKRSERAVFHMHATGSLPTKVVGGRLVAKKSKLLGIAG
jgi:hypothetical protein